MSIKMILFSLPISFSRIFLSKIICIDFLSILSFFSFKNQISLAFLSMILFSLSISFLKIFLSKVIFINVFVNNILFSFKDLIILDVFVNIVQSAKVEEHFKRWIILMFFKFWPNVEEFLNNSKLLKDFQNSFGIFFSTMIFMIFLNTKSSKTNLVRKILWNFFQSIIMMIPLKRI